MIFRLSFILKLHKLFVFPKLRVKLKNLKTIAELILTWSFKRLKQISQYLIIINLMIIINTIVISLKAYMKIPTKKISFEFNIRFASTIRGLIDT